MIQRALTSDQSPLRAEIIAFLTSAAGRLVWENSQSEARFHQQLAANAGQELGGLLQAVRSYERFARPVTDAFEACRREMARKPTKVSAATLGGLPEVQRGSGEAPEAFQSASDRLQQIELSALFEQNFAGLAESARADRWLEALLQHHFRIQRAKPPNGKNPWFERFDDGSFMVRAR